MVGQGPAVLATGDGRVGCFFNLAFSNASSLWGLLDILKYCGLSCSNPVTFGGVLAKYWLTA